MNLLPLYKKELRSYLNSPVAYVTGIFFLVFTSLWFFRIQTFFAQDTASMRSFFAILPMVFTFLIPAITMRSWAEERKMGTDELLLTLPFSDAGMVLGKFLAAMTLLAGMLFLTLPVPVMVSPFGHFDVGPIVTEYFGTLLLGAAAISIGMCVSAFSTNQVTSFVVSVIVLLALTLIGSLATAFQLPPYLSGVFQYLSLDLQFEGFAKGLIDTRSVAYFGVITILMLYLNMKLLMFRKWR